MADADKTDWVALARQLMASLHDLRPGGKPPSKDIEMHGEINALHVLHHHPEGMTPTTLARACRVSTARMTKTIGQLERRGLVEREASPKDRRSVTVRLTGDGEAEFGRRVSEIDRHVAGVLRELGEKDARELVRICGRLAAIFADHARGAGRPVAGCAGAGNGKKGDGADEAR